MALDIYTKWRVRDVDDMISDGFDYLRVYGCLTVSGTYVEITGIGTRPALIAATEYYSYTALATSYLYFKADLYNSTSGEASELSLPVGISSATTTAITDRAVLCSYCDAEGFQAAFKSFELDDIALTKAAFHKDGQLPWVPGTDWAVVMALCYTDATTGLQEGYNLTGSTVTITVKDRLGNTIDTFVSGTEITLASQGVQRSLSGTMGEFTLLIPDTAVPDYPAGATAYTPGVYDLDVKVAWADSDVSLEGRGKIEIVRA